MKGVGEHLNALRFREFRSTTQPIASVYIRKSIPTAANVSAQLKGFGIFGVSIHVQRPNLHRMLNSKDGVRRALNSRHAARRGFDSTSCIFLNDPPSKSSFMPKVQFLHELGHSTKFSLWLRLHPIETFVILSVLSSSFTIRAFPGLALATATMSLPWIVLLCLFGPRGLPLVDEVIADRITMCLCKAAVIHVDQKGQPLRARYKRFAELQEPDPRKGRARARAIDASHENVEIPQEMSFLLWFSGISNWFTSAAIAIAVWQFGKEID
jgi:hypothetical protein